MTVQRIVPVAVVDHDTVAVTSVHSGKRDRTTIRCDYRGAVLCADIKAGVVLPHAGYRMPAVADTAGYVIAGRAGPAPGSGGVSAASGVTAGVAASIAAVILISLFLLAALFFLLALKLGDHSLDLGARFIFSAAELVILGAAVLHIVLDLGDKRGSLVDLCLQLFLLGAKLFLLGLKLGLCLLILGLNALRLLAGGYVSVLKVAVALHYLTDVIHQREELAEAVCSEDDGEVVHAAVLFHCADTLAVALKLFFLALLRGLDFKLLVLYHLAVQLYLVVGQCYLLLGELIARIHSKLLLKHGCVLALQLINDVLLLLTLRGERVLLRLERVDLGLSYGVRIVRQDAEHKCEHHSQAEQYRDD